MCDIYSYCLIGNNGRLQHLRLCLLKCILTVVFVIRCLYRAVSLTLVREYRFKGIIHYCYCTADRVRLVVVLGIAFW